MPGQPRLLERARDLIRVKHYSIRTEEAYLNVIRRFILYHHKRHPSEMGVDKIRQYLSYLATDENVAASAQNVALSALLFLYREVLLIELPLVEGVERAKRPKRVPVVLTTKEVRKVLTHLTGIHYLLASLLYGADLRLTEAVRLRVKDLDFEYQQIIVRDGKGEKDRRTMLPEPIIEPLGCHLARVKLQHEEDKCARVWDSSPPLHAGAQVSECREGMALAVCVPRKQVVVGSPHQYHATTPYFRRSVAAGCSSGDQAGEHPEASELSHTASFVCHALIGSKL